MYLCMTEVNEEQKKKVDTIIRFWFCCRCCLCVILIIILILCLVFANPPMAIKKKLGRGSRVGATSSPNVLSKGKGKSLAGRSLSEEMWMTYSELHQFCKDKKLNLPLPKNQTAEDKLLARIIDDNSQSCKFVFLGYKANTYIRYQSLTGDITWPSLKIKLDAGIPTNKRDCVNLNFWYEERPRVLKTDKCGARSQTCLILLTHKKGRKYCQRYRYRCAEQHIGARNSTIAHFKAAKKSYRSDYTMLLLDTENYPEDLEFGTLYRQNCVALAVNYIFKYEFQNLEMPYKSKRFVVTDPEYDCLALNIGKRALVTVSCHEYACPFCV